MAVGLVAFMLLIFQAGTTAILANSYIKHSSFAYNVAAEEIEAVRNMSYAKLTDRTNSPFIETAYNSGSWQVTSAVDAPSGNHVFNLSPVTAQTPSSLMVIPGFDYSNFTVQSKIKILSGSPANWQAGLYFRYHDANNYYRAYYSSTNLYLEKRVNGVDTVLNSKAITFNTNTWYELKITAADTNFEIFINGASELTFTEATNDFTLGRLALLAANSGKAQFDDVIVTTAATQTWNFDADSVDSLPVTWQRFGLNDLPSGTGKLSIQNARAGFTDLKQITARVEWREKATTRFAEVTTYINQQNSLP